MRFRYRLFFFFSAVGLLPLILTWIVAHRMFVRSHQLVSSENAGITNRLVETSVQEKANLVAQQVSEYLQNHPNLVPDQFDTLIQNSDLFLLAVQPVGSSGHTFMYDTSGMIFFDQDESRIGEQLANIYGSIPDYWNLLETSFRDLPINGYYDLRGLEDREGQKYFASALVGNSDLRIAATTYVDEFSQFSNTAESNLVRPLRNINAWLTVGFIGAGVIIVILALIASNMTASPIEWLARNAAQFLHQLPEAAKDFHPITKRRDEVGMITNTQNFLTEQVRVEFEDLEKQVSARTAELTRRTKQLETAAQVARESALILNIDQLLKQTTQLISDRFGYYHVGVFLVDDLKENVVFYASNSPGGKRMLERKHKLQIGQGVVGVTAQRRVPSLVADVAKDPTYVANPDLPQTRSELALPLQARERLIGVLDVQSMQTEAYSEEDIRILRILADQLALAIENSRLFSQSQQVIHELEGLIGQQVRQTWSKRLGERSIIYSYDRLGNQKTSYLPVNPAQSTTDIDEKSYEDYLHHLCIPIHIQQLALGKIFLHRDPDQPIWSAEDRQLAQDAASQIAAALENARLLEEIRLRAQQESMVSQIVAKTQLSMDLESVLKTAVQEIGLAMNASRVSLRLGKP